MAQSIDSGVTLDVHGHVATIAFNQPEKRNAMRLRTWLALPAMVSSADRDGGVRLILFRGAGGLFGAGNDITEFGALRGDATAAAAYGKAMADAMQAIETTSKPVLMAIEGACYGASVALALAGDVRVAADNAVFALTPAKLGALYLRSDLHRLVAAVGVGLAKKLIYSAEPIGAARACQIGLVDEVLLKHRFEPELLRIVEGILAGSAFTLRRTKEMMRSVGYGPAPPETDESLAYFVEATQGDDFNEGVSAFLNKRTPRFRPSDASGSALPRPLKGLE